MSIRTVLILLLALVFGLSAALGVNLLMKKPEPERPETVTVVVAAVNVPRFGTLTTNQLRIREIPSDMVPAGALTQMEEAVDRAVYNGLVRDEVVLEGKLSAKGAKGRGMATAIPKGERAFTISTTTLASGVAGFILPGSRVDVLLTVTRTGGQNDPTGGGQTSTLLQDVEILAVDQLVDPGKTVDPKELRSVTLRVTPQQAAKLDLGQNKGILHLSLRNPEDHTAAVTRPATLADLGLFEEPPKQESKEPEKVPAPAPALAPPAAPARIRVMRGTLESGGVLFEPIDPARGER